MTLTRITNPPFERASEILTPEALDPSTILPKKQKNTPAVSFIDEVFKHFHNRFLCFI